MVHEGVICRRCIAIELSLSLSFSLQLYVSSFICSFVRSFVHSLVPDVAAPARDSRSGLFDEFSPDIYARFFSQFSAINAIAYKHL